MQLHRVPILHTAMQMQIIIHHSVQMQPDSVRSKHGGQKAVAHLCHLLRPSLAPEAAEPSKGKKNSTRLSWQLQNRARTSRTNYATEVSCCFSLPANLTHEKVETEPIRQSLDLPEFYYYRNSTFSKRKRTLFCPKRVMELRKARTPDPRIRPIYLARPNLLRRLAMAADQKESSHQTSHAK